MEQLEWKKEPLGNIELCTFMNQYRGSRPEINKISQLNDGVILLQAMFKIYSFKEEKIPFKNPKTD